MFSLVTHLSTVVIEIFKCLHSKYEDIPGPIIDGFTSTPHPPQGFDDQNCFSCSVAASALVYVAPGHASI